jgi:hypothetical protein
MNAADSPYDVATATLSEIDANLKIRQSFEILILPNAAIFQSSSCVGGHQKNAFKELLSLKGTDSSVNYRGLLILVCSTVEYFYKHVIENVVTERAKLAKEFNDLPRKLIAANFAYTGVSFQKNRDAYADGGMQNEFEDLLSGLSTCTPKSKKFKLNAKVFTSSLGNCTPNQLEKRFEELGLPPPFDDKIGTFSELKNHFDGGSTRSVAKNARKSLEELIIRRNNLVHSFTISETVTPDEVVTAINFSRALIGAIKQLVDNA